MLSISTLANCFSKADFVLKQIKKLLVPKLLLVYFAVMIIGIVSSFGQSVLTDKADYQPGDILIITGAGWQPGETVLLHIEESPAICVNGHSLTAVADANGNILNSQFVFKQSHLGLEFTLDAHGQTSGLTAHTTFTDGNPPVPYLMSSGNYQENFSDISNWSNAFASGIGSAPWASVGTNASGTIPDGMRITTSSGTFSTSTSGGVQKGTGNIILLSTGATDNSSSCAIDLMLDFTGRNAGTLSFNWVSVDNSTGDRKASMRVYTSIDGTTWTELAAAAVLNFTNNSATSGSRTSISLPVSFNNSATARIRFYNYNGTGGTTGSRPKIAIDDVFVTSNVPYTGGGNIVNGGVNFVGRINSYSQPTNCTGGDYRVLNYRRVSATSGTPSDGRGQWVTTVNVQSSGGNVTPDNMPGGGGAGFLLTSGGECGNAGTYLNKWNFNGVGQAAVDAINLTTLNGSTDMGINMSVAGRYTFVMKDVYNTNGPAFYVGRTTNAPVTLTHNTATQQTSIAYNGATITATLSASPSPQEIFYLRYRSATNDLSTNTSQVLGSVSGTTVTFNLTGLNSSTTVYYYILSTTHGSYSSLSEVDRSLAILNYADNSGSNYSFTTAASYTITATAGANGTISPAGSTVVGSGGSQAYTITANSGYYIADVLVDGVSNATAKSSGTYTFTNVTANRTISASFAPQINYVYHEATTANPGCGSDNFRSVQTPNNAQALKVAWKIEYQNQSNKTTLYYTTDGSNPSGAKGVASGTTIALNGNYSCTFSFNGVIDIATATIPAQAAGTVVKYIVSGWNSNGGSEVFANSGYSTTPITTAAGAAVFTYTVTSTTVDYANLQYPPSATINTGGTITAYARVWKSGVTEAAGQGAGILCWIGYSTTNTDPSTWSNWVPATYNADYGNNDEYIATFGSALPAGTYYFASRFQYLGGLYRYGGYNATGGNFWDGTDNVSGVLTVNCTNPAAPTISANGPTTFCSGGSVQLTSSYASGNVWSTGATTQSILVSSTGNYSVTYTNSFGCSASSVPTSVTVNQTPATPTISANGPLTFCEGGSVMLTSSSASGNNWSTGATTQSIVVATTGSYTVSVITSGCTSSNSVPSSVTVNSFGGSVTILNETVGTGNGILINNYSGWTSFSPINFSSTDATTDVRNNQNSSGYLGASGGSNVFLTTTQGLNFQVAGLNTTGLSGIALSFGIYKSTLASTGSDLLVEISADGINYSPLTYTALPTGSGTAIWYLRTATGSFPSTGNLRIRFRQTGTATQYRIDDIKLTGSTTSASISQANGCGGTVTLTASQGSSYSWSNNATSQSISVGNTGSYSVTITSSNDCTSTATVNVATLPTSLSATLASQTDVSCFGGNNGSVALNISGGTAPYSISPATTGLTAGAKTFTVSDANGCMTSVVTTINQPTVLAASGTTTAPLCNGGTGTVTVSATGGTQPYSGTGTFSVSAGATYSYVVTDANGCSKTVAGIMNNPTVVSAASTFTTIACFGGTSTVTVVGSGGTGQYMGTGNFTVSAGNYSYAITDGNGCQAITTGTIGQPMQITIAEHKTDVNCNGGNTGAISVDVSGGTPAAKLTVSEDFDGLASTGTGIAWMDNNTIANWYTNKTSYSTSDGSSTTGSLYSFGNNSDRAIGSIASGSTGIILGAWKIVNSTTQTLTSITVRYMGEQWRDAGNTTPQKLTFDYQVNAPNINTGTWIPVSALDFTSIKNTLSAAALDGNNASNRTLINNTFAISLPPGQSIWLRWTDIDNTGNDHGLAIDDLSAELLSVPNAASTPYTYIWSPSGATTATLSNLTAGNYTVTVKDGNNCSATKTVTIAEPAPLTTSESATACDSYTWALNGQSYNASGTYTHVYQNTNGCTVTASLVLTINQSTSHTTTATACDSYKWEEPLGNGQTYTMGGTYTNVTTNAAGCNHTETLVLTIKNSTSGTTTASACDSYTWSGPLGNGQTYTMGGTYTNVTTNAAGCNHTETLVLTIKNSTSGTTIASACDSYTWSGPLGNGQTYTMGGTYTNVTTNAAGCNHTETLVLTIKNSTSGTTTASACDSYTWSGPLGNGQTYTMGGTYTNVTTNAAGCNHTETLVLTIKNSTSGTTTASACDSYTWSGPLGNGQTYTTGGTYTNVTTNAAGCNHTETLELTINNSTSHTTTATACDSYTWSGPLGNGTTYTASGIYTNVTTNAAGCNHTETLELNINNSTSHTTTATACDSYTWNGPLGNGTTYTASGTYTNVTTNAAGCNHTETLVLTIKNSTSGTTTASACDSYTWSGPLGNGQTYTLGGTYTNVTTNAAGCNHTETLVLTIKNSTSGTTTASACDSYTWSGPLGNGQTYTLGGTYTNVTTNAAGCNHTETLVLTIKNSSSNTTTINACSSYTWSTPGGTGLTYTTSGTYTKPSMNAAGCTHTEILVLTINPPSNLNASGSSTPVQIGSGTTLYAQVSVGAGVPITFRVFNEANTQVFICSTAVTGSTGLASIPVPAANIGVVGVYKVVARAGNSCNDSAKAFFPVFDPTESFVTGGGWINSPIVTEAQYMQAAGIANFGFVSKYKKGTTQVDGNTEFQFQAGNLNFKSSSHETGSLVISGGRATYRGSGTINNIAGYKFVIVAIDGDWNGGTLPDKFRIKISRVSDGAVVYDNQYGKDENTADATVLGNNGTGGGSIVIHEVKATGKKVAVVDYAGAQTLEVKTANNPSLTGEAFILKFRSDDLRTPIDLKVLDASGKPVEQRQHILPGATLHIGRSYTSGLYFAEASQNGRRVILKLLRQ